MNTVELDFDDSLKKAIADVASNMESYSVTDRAFLCDVRLKDGRFVQAQLCLTCDPPDKIDDGGMPWIIDLTEQ